MTEKLLCKSCGQPISGIRSALVEWVVTDTGAAGFKIIHDIKTSPRGREGCSWHVYAGRDDPIQHLEAEKFLEPAHLAENIAGKIKDVGLLLEILRTLAGKSDRHVRAIASLEGLGRAGVPALAEILSSEYPEERRAAALVLARLGDKSLSAAASLTKTLEDEDPDVRFRAAFALKVLGGIQYQEQAEIVIRELAFAMGPLDSLEPFTEGSDLVRGIITGETMLSGELLTDAAGRAFLAPEEDYRGGNMGSVRTYGRRGKGSGKIRVTSGVFERGIGIWIEDLEKL